VAVGLGDADNISCGIKDRVGEANDVTVDERMDGLLFIEVGEGGGDGFGMDVVILDAGGCRTTWHFVDLRGHAAGLHQLECQCSPGSPLF